MLLQMQYAFGRAPQPPVLVERMQFRLKRESITLVFMVLGWASKRVNMGIGWVCLPRIQGSRQYPGYFCPQQQLERWA